MAAGSTFTSICHLYFFVHALKFSASRYHSFDDKTK